MHLLTLSNNWHIRPLKSFHHGIYPRDEAGWLPIEVPSHWQQHPALEHHAGKVVYRCRFGRAELCEPSDMPGASQRYWLKINGAFYWSQPYMNGVDLGRHEGYFIPYEREITNLLAAENTLLIEVDCPDEHDKFGKRMITGVFSHWDCIDPATNPGGLWLPVEIHGSGPVRLHAARYHTETFSSQVAQLHYALDLDAAQAGPVTLRWTIAPRNFSGSSQIVEQQRTLRAGQHTLHGLLKVREPRLWWTHDLGDPNLYTITLEVWHGGQCSDQHATAFGIRSFELRNWIPHLNGTRFLIKGNNYPPGDMRIATMTPERVAQDLRLVRECHMNLLRVHAHVDHPALYEAADKTGILLWQDFPLQWLYRPTVLPEALRQARAMVHLLYNHPSVAIWCMHNEAFFVADTSDETLLTRLRTYNSVLGYSWNRDIMDSQLKRLVEREDPRRPVVRSSGEFRKPPRWNGTDAHAYFGWYKTYGTLREAEIMRQRFTPNLSFVTEFGSQSFPNLESSLKFMDADVRTLDVAHLASRHGFQAEIMSNWFPWQEATSLADLIEMTQDYQIYINRYYIDRLRYHKYRPTGGIVPFLFLDPFPAILWSVVDYWRVPKRSYYAMRVGFSPQYAFTLYEPRTYQVGEPVSLPLYMVNDAQRPANNLHLTARLSDPEGNTMAEVQHDVSLPADCETKEIDRLRLTPPRAGRYQLEITLLGGVDEIRQIYEVEVVPVAEGNGRWGRQNERRPAGAAG
ncbi:MAG: glycoside hydrolase [Chloroflexaceae bacterium]|nr:glycoside hydrolase [Chloroflexaceae bacterium]